MKYLSILFPCVALAASLQASILIDFDTASAYTDNFTKVSTGGTIGFNSNGYVEASGTERISSIYSPANDFLTETISMTFQVGAAQNGDVGLYARTRADGGGIRAAALFGRSGNPANGSYFTLALHFGGANFLLGSNTGTSFYAGPTVYLNRYIDPVNDVFVFTLEQRQQEDMNAEFRISLSLNGTELANSNWVTMINSGFNNPGGVGMYFRPANLGSVQAYSFAVVPEPSLGLAGLLSLSFFSLLKRSRNRKANAV